MSIKIQFLIPVFTFGLFLGGCQQEQATEKAPEKDAPTAQAAEKEESALEIQAQSAPDTLKGSPKAVATGTIGTAQMTIHYHSPAVRGRVIWGGLVPYGQVWVTGAHSATQLETNKPLTVGGRALPAGKYALFTIPNRGEWILIINKNWEQHLADDYSEQDDLVRVAVKPEAQETNQERLRYQIEPADNKTGNLVISWEKIKVRLPLKQ